MWILNNTVLNNQWVKEESKGKWEKYFYMIENEDTMYQNLQDAAKAVSSRKFVAVNTCIKKWRKISVNNNLFNLKTLEQEECAEGRK